ncbi:MAG: exonuclease subunit SbcD [bacterium]|nr:exonuclease subunit SbcD [bacterium]
MSEPIVCLHIADLHFGMENYGHVNPQTGMHTRLEDFSNSLNQAIDYAIDSPVDAAIFAGDAYKRNSPSPTEQRELVKAFQRLADAEIPTVMISGNHDIPVMHGRASSIDIFRSVRPGWFHVFVNRPTLSDAPLIQTKKGPLAVCCLPYISPSFLLNNPENRGLKGDALRDRYETFYQDVMRSMARQIDDDVPRVLAAHLTVHGSITGGYRGAPLLTDDVQILPSNLAAAGYDYVALGHIHQYQNLSPREEVPVVYCGSIDRIDFGEAEEQKGFVIARIRRGRAEHEFIPIQTRDFIDIHVERSERLNLTERILIAIEREAVKGAVVRLRYEATDEEAAGLDMKRVQEALQTAHHKAGVIRVPNRAANERRSQTLKDDVSLRDALTAYLSQHADFQKDAEALQQKATEIDQAVRGRL